MAQKTDPETLNSGNLETEVLDAGDGNYFQFAQLTSVRSSGILLYSIALDVSNDGTNFARVAEGVSIPTDVALGARIYARYVKGRLVVPNGCGVVVQIACQE